MTPARGRAPEGYRRDVPSGITGHGHRLASLYRPAILTTGYEETVAPRPADAAPAEGRIMRIFGPVMRPRGTPARRPASSDALRLTQPGPKRPGPQASVRASIIGPQIRMTGPGRDPAWGAR